MKKRDRELLEKVGKYYLQYKEIIDIDKLLSTFRGTQEIPVSDFTLSYIYYYIMYIVTKDAVRSAEMARRSKLTYREFAVEYSQDLYGELNVGLTVPVYPVGLVAYYTFTEGYNAPEYAVLGYLLRRIYSIVKGKREKITVSTPPLKYFNFLDEFNKELSKLEEVKEYFPEGYYRCPSYTDPDWLTRAYKSYFLAEKLESIKVGMKKKGGEEEKVNKDLIKFMMWKLYELYTFYLVAKYLESKGYEIKKEGEEYIAKKGDKYISLVFNAPLPHSSLIKVDEEESIDKYKGRPDISVVQGRPIIFECKYSTRVSYITMGRFKIMAYTYEYNPLTAVLVYPGLETEETDVDSEDGATRRLDYITKKKDGLLNFEYNNHVLYMMIIDPLVEDEENLSRIDRLLGKYV
ncbi:hypothetical protein [Acidianus sp. HS-5]|uniref:hypothetical protein n=1 Tax=Acidianus sp. HS-5 TaxID=2886040 RepID=UPI001F31204A|nr:hypothetical protein [Acidianus sp. HS-5]BDC18721.1 hypothetical protein HS5_16110 [Acidianus sp. HS-5]